MFEQDLKCHTQPIFRCLEHAKAARSAISCRYLPSLCEARMQLRIPSELWGAIPAGLAQVYGHGQGGTLWVA